MAAPKTTAPTLLLDDLQRKHGVEGGAEQFLRLVAAASSVAGCIGAYGRNEHRSAWDHTISKARSICKRDWREFLDDGAPEFVAPVTTEEAPTSDVKHSLAGEVRDSLDAIDLSKVERIAIGGPEAEEVAQHMHVSEDDSPEAPKKAPKLWSEEHLPSRFEGGIQRPRLVEPPPEASGEEWCEYLTGISTFKEAVHSCRLKCIPGRTYAGIIPFADLHLGKEGSLFRKFRALVDWVCEREGYYLLGLGDLLNNPTLKSVEADQLGAQTATVGQAGRALACALAEAARKKKLIALLTGNHEQRMVRDTGQDVDPTQQLAEKLQVPFAGYEAPFVFEVGEQTYTLYANHGTGGGQTMGYVLATLERMGTNHRCDVVVMAHRHVKVVNQRAHYRVVGPVEGEDLAENDPAYQYRQQIDYHVAAGCYCLPVPSSFGRKIQQPPSVTGTVTIRLHADEHQKHARI